MGPSQGSGKRRMVADINVTPLVDVMLVLLIIFMVTAPMMTQGLNVDLPETTAKALRQEEKPIIVDVTKDGEIAINNIKQSRTLMADELKKIYQGNKEQLILLRADKHVAYGQVALVMSDIQSAGFSKVGMVTKTPEKE